MQDMVWAWWHTGLLLMALGIALPLFIRYSRKAEVKRRAEEKAALVELEEKQAEVRAVQQRKGTHDQHGHRLCITCNDKMTRATQPAFLIEQSEGWWDLVRRAFGAPARYTIRQLKKGPNVVNVYCNECAALMLLEHEEFILRYEKKIREFRRDAGVELRRWMKFGCNDAVILLIEKHDERIKSTEPQPKRAAVVPLKTENDGG